jgi:hypothetical protein
MEIGYAFQQPGFSFFISSAGISYKYEASDKIQQRISYRRQPAFLCMGRACLYFAAYRQSDNELFGYRSYDAMA